MVESREANISRRKTIWILNPRPNINKFQKESHRLKSTRLRWRSAGPWKTISKPWLRNLENVKHRVASCLSKCLFFPFCLFLVELQHKITSLLIPYLCLFWALYFLMSQSVVVEKFKWFKWEISSIALNFISKTVWFTGCGEGKPKGVMKKMKIASIHLLVQVSITGLLTAMK